MNNLQHNEAIQRLVSVKRAITDNCMIAGGSVRDFIMGRECEDVDIFFTCPDNINPFVFHKRLEDAMGRKIDAILTGEGLPEEYKSPYIDAVYKFSGKYSQYDIIKTKHPAHLIYKKFPLSICQAWMDVDGVARSSVAFKRGLEFNQIERIAETPTHQRYLDKIAGKFPDMLRVGWDANPIVVDRPELVARARNDIVARAREIVEQMRGRNPVPPPAPQPIANPFEPMPWGRPEARAAFEERQRQMEENAQLMAAQPPVLHGPRHDLVWRGEVDWDAIRPQQAPRFAGDE